MRKFIKLGVVLLCIYSIILQREPVIAGPQENSFKNTSEIDDRLDEVYTKERKRKAEKEENSLQKYRSKIKSYIDKKYYAKDKEKYQPILDIGKKLYEPYFNGKKSKGGVVRLHLTLLFFNELVVIHETEVYGSVEKEKKLHDLKTRAQAELTRLDALDEYTLNKQQVDFPGLTDLKPQIQDLYYLTQSASPKKMNTIGCNIGVGFCWGAGFGGSIGSTTNPLGGRKVAVSIQGSGSIGLIGGPYGPYIMLGKYNTSCSKKKLFSVLSGGTGGLGPGGSVLFDDSNNTKKHNGVEIGIIFGGALKAIVSTGVEIIPLPTDWKYVRENLLNVKACNGLIPDSVKEELESADSINRLKEIKKRFKNNYKLEKTEDSTSLHARLNTEEGNNNNDNVLGKKDENAILTLGELDQGH